MLRQVAYEDIRPIAIGAGILGTGGGGNPYLGSLQLGAEIRQRGPQKIINPDELADDALVALVGGIGAPTVSIEKLPQGTEMSRALGHLENHLGKKIDAIAIAEIGGANSMQPMIAGLQSGLPTIDSDGMGRAFPEIQMASFLFSAGATVAPFAMVDCGVNVIVMPKVATSKWGERLARNVAITMGARAGFAGMVMSGKHLKQTGVHYTLTLAHRLGHRVLQAQERHEDVPAAAAELLAGKVMFRGKIVDVDRRTTRGFARGSVTLESFSGGDQLHIKFQNEYLVAYLNSDAVVTVPDMICIVEDESGEPVTTEVLRYGVRVAVLAVPTAARMKTPAALEVVGPRAFGYDLDFQPLPGERIGLAPPTMEEILGRAN